MTPTSKKRLIVLFILILVIGIGWIGWYRPSSQPQAQTSEKASAASQGRPALTVDVIKPKLMMMHVKILANGNIEAWQEAVIGAEVNGLAIKEVLVNVGDHVKKGQPLARFNSSTLLADLAQTEANLAEAQAALIEAESNASRARSIQDSGALSKSQIEQYLSNEASAKARVQSAVATVQSQKIKLSQTTLMAPDDGIISQRNATSGQVVSAGTELFRLIRQSRIEWRGEFNAEVINNIKPGMVVSLTLPDQSNVAGKVRMLAPTTDNTTRNTLVYADLPNGKAKPGMFAKGEIALPETEVLAMPYDAIVMRDGFSYLMEVDSTQHIRQRKVQLGSRAGNMVEIVGGINPQASFVASGGAFLADGDLVRVNVSNPTTQQATQSQ